MINVFNSNIWTQKENFTSKPDLGCLLKHLIPSNSIILVLESCIYIMYHGHDYFENKTCWISKFWFAFSWFYMQEKNYLCGLWRAKTQEMQETPIRKQTNRQTNKKTNKQTNKKTKTKTKKDKKRQKQKKTKKKKKKKQNKTKQKIKSKPWRRPFLFKEFKVACIFEYLHKTGEDR